MTEISKTTKIARINNVDIVVIENGEKMVAIAPLCDALGVASNGQIERIKNDPILGSTHKLSLSVGADGVERKMFTIPLKYVFGWLFRIDSRNVKEESREVVLQYQMMCYDALYNYFSSYADFVETKQKFIEEQLTVVESAKTNFKSARVVLEDADKRLKVLRKLTFDNFDAEKRQLKFDFNGE